jgi:hypothetical protein
MEGKKEDDNDLEYYGSEDEDDSENEKVSTEHVNEAVGVNVDYALCGGGKAAKTIAGKVTAMKHFQLFCTNVLKHGPWELLTEAVICVLKVFQMFGTYLVNDARNMTNGDLLMQRSASQVYSRVKETFRQKWRLNKMFTQVITC